MESDLQSFSKKCRCCLQGIEDQEKLIIGEIIREKFFEMTQFELAYSTKLPQFICYSCFSILSRYVALRKGFIDNQNILNSLLKKIDEKLDFYVKVEAIHEHKTTNCNENQDIIGIRNVENLYHVEEFDDKHVKNERSTVEMPSKTIFCSICNKTFLNQQTLKNHSNRMHLKLKKHQCSLCSYKCFSSFELNRHKISNHKDEFPPLKKFLCNLCDVQFSQNSCLIMHKKTHHFKLTRYECDKCGHKTYKKENLLKHMNTHIPDSYKSLFKCTLCPSQLSSLYILMLHKKNIHHIHQKNYKCTHPNCEKSFSREISLKEHQKFVHLKYRPVNCDKCEMSFSSNSHLSRHKKRKHLNSNNNLLVID